MIICVCSKCKLADLLENEYEKTCFKCGGSFVSTGYTSDKWLTLTTEEMTRVINNKFQEINPQPSKVNAAINAKAKVEATNQAATKAQVMKSSTNPAKPTEAVKTPEVIIATIPGSGETPYNADASYKDDFDYDSKASASTVNNVNPINMMPVEPSPAPVTPESSSGISSLSIVSFILSFFACLSLVSLSLAIVDLVKNKGRKKGLSIAAIVISTLFILGSIVLVVLEALAVTSVFPFIGDFFSNLGYGNDYAYEEYYQPEEYYEEDDYEYYEDSEVTDTEEIVEDEIPETVPDNTYEEIYYDYSLKFQDEYMTLSSELEELVTSGKDVEEIQSTYTSMMESLSDLYALGQEEMAALLNMQPATEDEFSIWSESLDELYAQYSNNLDVIYRSGMGEDLSTELTGDMEANDIESDSELSSARNRSRVNESEQYSDDSNYDEDSYYEEPDVYYFEDDENVYATFGDDM